VMEEKWTPGPWSICGEERGGCVCGQIWSTSKDYRVADATRTFPDSMEELPSREESIANARLISAAPDLYMGHLMTKMVKAIDGTGTSKKCDALLAVAEKCGYGRGESIFEFIEAYIAAAMKKAEGE